MIVADTGAMLGLLDAGDRHHARLRELYDARPAAWVLPWAILPEVDYLAGAELGPAAQDAFLADLVSGAFRVEWGRQDDLSAAQRLCRKYRSLRLGLVDALVMATAERLGPEAIATTDLRDFGAVSLKGQPKLYPRDL